VSPERSLVVNPSYLRNQRDTLAAEVLDGTLDASAFPRKFSAIVDEWIRPLFLEATDGREKGYALVAVGGYGRGELAPGSDLDLVLVYKHRRHSKQVAERIWYSIWDTGMRLDHSVRTPSETIGMARENLKVVLGLLDARVIAGDASLGEPLQAAARDLWRKEASGYLKELYGQVV
jgi:[protein-PII] uridylyltransferase